MRLGVLTTKLGISQPGVLMTHSLNNLVDSEPNLEVVLFYEDYDKIPEQPHFSMMQNVFAWEYDNSVLISTDEQSARLLCNIPNHSTKFHYMWSLWWTIKPKQFLEYSQLLQNENVGLIARSHSHAAILTKLWQQPQYVIEDFNDEQLAQICHEHGGQV
jgi:hypothetical protein